MNEEIRIVCLWYNSVILVMETTEDRIGEMLLSGETMHLECKLAKGGLPRSLWETYSSFANTDGGLILLGVKETDHQFSVHGVSDPDQLIRDFWNTAHDRSKVNLCHLANEDVAAINYCGARIVVIHIPTVERSSRPVFINGNPYGGTYIRLHEGDYRCTDAMVDRMFADRSDTRDAVIFNKYGLADLDSSTFSGYRQRFRLWQPGHPFNDYDDLKFLAAIGGYAIDRETDKEGLTLAGLLMFGNLRAILDNVTNYTVDYREYEDNQGVMDRWVDRVTTDFMWPGNVFSFCNIVFRKMGVAIKVPFRLEGNVRKDETPQHVALREAVVNTLIHADYSGRTAILALKYPDRFEFINPGTLRVTSDEAMHGWKSDCRNRKMQKMFQFIGYAEQGGSGFDKIFKGWREAHWADPSIYDDKTKDETYLTMPLYPEKVDTFPEKVTFGPKKVTSSSEKVTFGPKKVTSSPEKVTTVPTVDQLLSGRKLTRPTDDNVRLLFAAFGPIATFSRSQVISVTNLSDAGAGRLLRTLRASGILVSSAEYGKYRFGDRK